MTTPFLCTLTDVQSRLSTVGVTLRLDDDPSVFQQILQRSTNKLLLYTEPLYDFNEILIDSQAGGWTNDRACDIAAYYLCTRRANPAPASVLAEYKEALQSLEDIRVDQMQIPNVFQRHRSSPTFSNVRVDQSYLTAKIRVDKSTSEFSPTLGYSQWINWDTLGVIEY